MGRVSTAREAPQSPQKRRNPALEQFKREKGRSRNACDRCKQKKVKCDGEGLQTCSICQEGDFHCNYAQKALNEKSQYRKGYVEMVEEASEYYKAGLHRLYDLFRDADVFAELRQKYTRPDQRPTAQEIVRFSGVPSADKPHEGGVERIREYLEAEDRPILVRQGEWDRVPSTDQPPSPSTTASSASIASPELGPSTDAEMTDHDSAPTQSRATYAPTPPVKSQSPVLSFPSPTYPPTNTTKQSPALSQHNPIPAARSRSPLPHHAPYTYPGALPAYQPSHPNGSLRSHPRLPLTTGGSLRHTPYPSPASLSPPSAQPSTFAQRPRAASATQNGTYAADVTPSPPTVTVCPADLDLGTAPAPGQAMDLTFSGYENSTMVNPMSMLGGDGPGRDAPAVTVEEFEAAIAAAAAANPSSHGAAWGWDGRVTAQWT